MGIYQIIRGDIVCDKCKKFLGVVTFDKKEEDRMYKSTLICVDCGAKPVSDETINPTTS